jgi:hypothetical protein
MVRGQRSGDDLVGFLNAAFSRNAGPDKVIRALCYIANLLTLVFSGMIITVDNEPQVLFGMLLIITMNVTAFLLKPAASART